MKRKFNQKGFAITSFLYSIFLLSIVFLVLIFLVIANSSSTFFKFQKTIKNKLDELGYTADKINNYATITYDENASVIDEGENFDLLEGVKLIRYDGVELDNKITYTSNPTFNKDQGGKYLITYQATVDGKIVKINRVITVVSKDDGNNGVLATITSKVPNENDVETYTNGQLINLGEYGIRYQGYDPDNYIYFNCENYSNQTSETCETWRIIGVVDGKVKIISEEIGTMAWDDPNGNGQYDFVEVNDWNNSTLKSYLNGESEGDYYASLTEATRNSNYISPSTWYLRGHNTAQVTKDVMYNLERTTGTLLHETPYIDDTKIGLMYPSDWAYAAMEIESCLSTVTLNSYYLCKPSNWINQGSTNSQWLITLNSEWSDFAFIANGYLSGCNVYIFVGVRPVLYLSSDVELEGEGTQNTPYKLKTK